MPSPQISVPGVTAPVQGPQAPNSPLPAQVCFPFLQAPTAPPTRPGKQAWDAPGLQAQLSSTWPSRSSS